MRGTFRDPTKIMQFGDFAEGSQAIRGPVGPNVFVDKYCCGPHFTYVGSADRVRMGDDTHAAGVSKDLRQWLSN
jgi:hypothetical protein